MTEPPHDADAWQRNYETKLAEIEQRNERMQQELDDVEVTERSSDGAISVTVNSQGNLTDLQLADVLRRRDGKSVSQEVLRLVSTARPRVTPPPNSARGTGAPHTPCRETAGGGPWRERSSGVRR